MVTSIVRTFKRPTLSSPSAKNSPKKMKKSNPHRDIEVALHKGCIGSATIKDINGIPAFFKPVALALDGGEVAALEYVGTYSLQDDDGGLIRHLTNGTSPRMLPTQSIFFGAESPEILMEKGRMIASFFREKVKPFRGGEFDTTVTTTQEPDCENMRKLHKVIGVFNASAVICQLFYEHLIQYGFEGLEGELDKYFEYSMHDEETVRRIIRYKFTELFEESIPTPGH